MSDQPAPTPHDPTGSFSPLDAVIAAYLQAVEAGVPVDRGEILARHPDLAADLAVFFANHDRIDRATAPIRLEASPDPASAPAPLVPGLVRYFGDYELVEEVARGGMGVVYRARQISLNRVVALKMILAGAFATPRDVQRFRLEAESAANLDHPHIVPVYEVGEHEARQYFAMKFVEGTSLAAHPRGTPREEVAGLLEVARAIHSAHLHGVLHRDLKPSNILVDLEGRRLVTDFGLAKRLGEGDGSLTETGQLLGTPRYMAPEQALGRRDLTVAADVYALGAILFDRLVGHPPFLSENVVSLLHQVRETEPPRLSSLLPGLGRDLETIVQKCLEKDPTRRYATAEALATDLENYLEGRPIVARPVGPAARAWRWCRRNPAVASLMTGVAASLLLGTIVSLTFAFRAEERATEASLAATRSRVLLAQGVEDDDVRMLNYAKTYAQAPPGKAGDDLRWVIQANLVLASQRKKPYPLERTEPILPITASALSQDGKRWAEGSVDGTVRVWELPSGRLIRKLPPLEGPVEGIVFSPDAKSVASWCPTSSAEEHELYRSSIWLQWPSGGKESYRYMFSENNYRRNDSKEGTVSVWHVESGQTQVRFPWKGTRNVISFSRDGRRLVSGARIGDYSNKDVVSLWEVPQPVLSDFSARNQSEKRSRPLLELKPSRPGWSSDMFDLSPDGKFFITIGPDPDAVSVYEIFSERQLFRLDSGSKNGPRALGWDTTRQEIALLDGKFQLRFLDVYSGKERHSPLKLDESSAFQGEIRFSPDGRYFWGQKRNDIYEVYSRQSLKRVSQFGGRIHSFSRDGSMLFLNDGRVFETRNWTRLRPPDGKRFHPAIQEITLLGRFFFDTDSGYITSSKYMWDLPTELKVVTDYPSDSSEISEGVFWRDSGLQFLPRGLLTNLGDIIPLWAELLTRKRLVGENEIEDLSEAEWDERRRELQRRLPANVSPVLKAMADDRAYWRRLEATPIGYNPKKELVAIDRLIELEPSWYYRETRGRAHARLEQWDEAARDVARAAREAGAWYWDARSDPLLLLSGKDSLLKLREHSVLLFDNQPAQTLRDRYHFGPEVVEVAIHDLEFLNRDLEELLQAAEVALNNADPSPDLILKVLALLGSHPRTGKPSDSVRRFEEGPSMVWGPLKGLALYRAGRFEEARADLLGQVSLDLDKDRTEKCELLLAMTEFKLGQLSQANEWLKQVKNADFLRDRLDGGMGALEPEIKQLRAELLAEAENLILENGFPADPFAR